MVKILNSLTDDYEKQMEDLEDKIGNTVNDALTIKLICEKLTLRYERLCKKAKKSREEEYGNETALYAGGFKGRCHNCGEYGHKAMNCKDNDGRGSGGNKQEDTHGSGFKGKCFECNDTDDMCTPEEIAQFGRPKVNGMDNKVLTMVMSSATLQDDINLKVYYPRGSETEVASLPSVGPLMAHLQYFMMQLAEHEVTNGQGYIGEGYRIVFSFRCLGPFQQNRAMVNLCCCLVHVLST